ncbi:MAG TPA: ComEC/Rec2 family competence protein, partial [Candidatus Saccharibacteria bacterium]|nr:ComEC/Rec2 family competence protein [Candidatus Saccharibacteria bacterium]
ITRLFYKKPEDAPSIVQLLIETTSAQVMTLPIIAVAFGTFSVLALPANLLVAPIIPLAMLATFIAGLAALVAPALWVVALPASIIIAYIVAVVVWLAELPWASVQMTLTLPGVTIWYGVLAAIVGLIWYKKRVDLRAGSIVD